MISSDGESVLAPRACSACKKQKRRCDKQLPECSLCLRMSRYCDYNEAAVANGPTDNSEALQNRITELEILLLQKNQKIEQQADQLRQNGQLHISAARSVHLNPFETFPALFFLDNETFQEVKIPIPKPCPAIPQGIYETMGNIDSLNKMAQRFFATIHVWFPIFPRKRMELLLSESSFEPTPGQALLLSAMRLLIDEERPSSRKNIYWTVKNYAVALEGNAVMSPQLLQATVLIALYEIGHAIYPAAYLSTGRCATLGKALGLDNRKDAPQMLRRYGVWLEVEEQKRLWWAVLLLDRYVHIGLRGHALATEDPHHDEILPVEDSQYEQSQMVGREPLYVQSPTSIKAGPFTRTCQATNLLGKVVNVLNELSTDSETRFSTALQIFRTLSSFIKLVQDEFAERPIAYATAMAISYSALIGLFDPFCCTATHKGAHSNEEAELQAISITGIVEVSDDISKFASQLKSSTSKDPAAISPLLGNCLYMGTITFAWRVYEGERDGALESYRTLRDVLSNLNGRWAVGGEYLYSVDKAKEAIYNSPLL